MKDKYEFEVVPTAIVEGELFEGPPRKYVVLTEETTNPVCTVTQIADDEHFVMKIGDPLTLLGYKAPKPE